MDIAPAEASDSVVDSSVAPDASSSRISLADIPAIARMLIPSAASVAVNLVVAPIS